MSKKDRIKKILEQLTSGLHEREEIIAVAFLAAVSGQNTFLLGPSGTAKSLISRRISCAFKDAEYFEYLMNRFSTPDDIFGPVSIKALKEDKYTRKTSGYLPAVDFAFLDEIWKSSPAILNTLLTLVNERIFRNGGNIEKAPLKALISASNETPPENQGLEALYDRFPVRLFVGPLADRSNFETLINSKPTGAQVALDKNLMVSNDEWSKWQQNIHDVSLSKETINVINLIRNALSSMDEETAVYVSDRRWQRAALLLKASAFLCDRNTTNLSDTLLLRHCLWTTEKNRKNVVNMVEDAVKKSGLPTDVDIARWDKSKEKLDQDISSKFHYTNHIYVSEELGEEKLEVFKVLPSRIELSYRDTETFFIPVAKSRSKDNFHPIDDQGNLIKNLTCSFDNQNSCTIKYEDTYNPRRNRGVSFYPAEHEEAIFTPRIQHKKGARRKDITEIQKEVYSNKVRELQVNFKAALTEVSSQKSKVEQQLEIPFVSKKIRALAYESIADQIHRLDVRIKDCDLLLKKIDPDIDLEKAA